MKSLNFILLSIIIVACATTGSSLLRFQDREFLIHPDLPSLAYPHNYDECVDRKGPWRILGKKCKTKHKIDIYDLNDEQTRKDLINAGFTCKSAMRFKY